MVNGAHLVIKTSSSTVEDAFEALRMFAFMILSEFIAHTIDAYYSLSLGKNSNSISVNHFFSYHPSYELGVNNILMERGMIKVLR